MKFTKPIAYQEIDGKRVEVEVEYKVESLQLKDENTKCETRNTKLKTLNAKLASTKPNPKSKNPKSEYGFTVASYDRTKDLIIDPLLASTYLGGSGVEEWGYSPYPRHKRECICNGRDLFNRLSDYERGL